MSQHKDKATGKWYYTGKYKDLMGERHDYKKRGFDTKKKAKEAEEAFLIKIKGGSGRIKMKALIELYHTESASSIKQSTLKAYRRLEALSILPVFGDRYCDDIKTMEVKKWIESIFQDGIDGRRYSYSTTRNLLLHLSGLFTFAVDHEILAKNPCRKVKPPKDPNAVIEKQNSEINFWEVDEYKRFIATIDDIDRVDIYEFFFLTGVRIGELAALQWSDLNFDTSKLFITKAVSAITTTITTPKTTNSIRVIDMPKRLMKRLEARYERKKKTDGFTDSYFIFGDLRHASHATIRRWFNEDVAKSGVKKITVHGLRHSHASYLLSNPMVSELLVAERMGHTVEMLRSTYAHIYENRRSIMLDYIENL